MKRTHTGLWVTWIALLIFFILKTIDHYFGTQTVINVPLANNRFIIIAAGIAFVILGCKCVSNLYSNTTYKSEIQKDTVIKIINRIEEKRDDTVVFSIYLDEDIYFLRKDMTPNKFQSVEQLEKEHNTLIVGKSYRKDRHTGKLIPLD